MIIYKTRHSKWQPAWSTDNWVGAFGNSDFTYTYAIKLNPTPEHVLEDKMILSIRDGSWQVFNEEPVI